MASTIATSADNIYIVVDENVTRSSGDLSVSRGVFDGSALMVRTKITSPFPTTPPQKTKKNTSNPPNPNPK